MSVAKPAREPKMKVVGRRRPSAGGLEAADNLFRLVLFLRGAQPFFPKGVYKFRSFEEKEAWEWQMRAR